MLVACFGMVYLLWLFVSLAWVFWADLICLWVGFPGLWVVLYFGFSGCTVAFWLAVVFHGVEVCAVLS